MAGTLDRRASDPPPKRLIGRPALLASGRVDRDIGRQVRAGELERVTRGWYRAGPSPDREREALDRVMAMLQRAPSLVASHESAVLMQVLPLVYADLSTVHLTRNARTGARRTAGRILHARPLDQSEIIVINGLQVTSVARTLVDLGCGATDARTVIGVADAALYQRRITPQELGTALAGAGHRTGLGRARVLLGFADGRAESVGESVLRWLLAEAGLPVPEPQVEVFAPDGSYIGRVDFAYATHGVVIEFDGFVKYQGLLRPGEDASQAVIKEKLREDRLREAGLIVLRFVWADFADPAAMVARIVAAVKQGQRAKRAGLVSAVLTSTPALQIG